MSLAAALRRPDIPLESRAQVEQRWEAAVDGQAHDLRVAGDGSLIAIGGSREGAGVVSLLDRGGKQLWKYITREPIRCVSVSDVGGFVAAGCDDAQVYFFDRRGLLLWRYKCDQRVTGVGVSRDGNVLAAGSEDQGVYYFDNRNTPRRFVWKLRMEGLVNSVAIVPSGENILAGAQDGGIYFMDSREGAVIWKAFAHAPVLCVAASKFADVMAAGADDGSLHCFDFGGKLLWERQTAGAILDVSLDNRGAFVAALSKDGTLYCFDAKGGALLWSHATGSDGGRVKLTKNGDLVFVVTDDDRVLCLSADEGLIFDAHAGGKAVTLDVSADSETLLLLETEHLRAFETKAIFKSLILSLREYILKCRTRGAEIEAALAFEKQAVSALKNFDYKGVHTAVLSAEGSLRESLAKLSEDSEVQKRATEALEHLRKSEEEARGLGFDTSAVRQVLEAARAANGAKDYGKVVAVITDARGRLADLDKKREGLERAKRAIEGAERAVESASRYEGVNVRDARSQLELARTSLAERDFTMAGEYGALAQEIVLQARRASPVAVDAEIAEVRAKVQGGPVEAGEVAALEGSLAGAIAHYQGRRAFKQLGETYELLDTLWSHSAKAKASAPGPSPKHALEAAAFAYLDAGDAGRACEIAERALDYKFALKLRERAKEKDAAGRLVERMQAEGRQKRQDLASDGRKMDDYIGSLVASRRFAEAAAELMKFERYAEAISLLEGQRDPVSAAFLIRIHFHLNQQERVLAACRAGEGAIREEVRKGASELLPFYGRLLVGHAFTAQVLGAASETDRVGQEWSFFLEAFERRQGQPAERDLDGAALFAYLARGDRARVRELAAHRQGPFYEWVRDAEVMVERGNLKGFRKMLALFDRDFVQRSVHMGSALKALLPPSNAADALDELFPFNVNGQLLEAYRATLNHDVLTRMRAQGDKFFEAKEYEKALPFYRDILARDAFALLPRAQVAGKAAAVYLARGDESGARAFAREFALDEQAVVEEARKAPGAPAPPAPGVAGPAPSPEGKRCGNCGELVPRVAVRCFKCGSPIR